MMGRNVAGMQNRVSEWGYTSSRRYDDPANEISLDVLFSDAAGGQWTVPAFWAGDHDWRVRFAPPQAGDYRFETRCSDPGNDELHGRAGTLTAEPHDGRNALYRHGRLCVADDRRHLQHTDGTPFFWLGDTWWMGLCKRLSWPGDFRALTADRVAKGFSVIQIIAGLYPDMPAFDPRGANEAGFPWEPEYARPNAAYFDMADLRLDWLVSAGLTPCIVGCWGYFMTWMGIDKMKQHWRNLVARYAAYPVVWCLAGEATMPYYLSTTKEADAQQQRTDWTELARYVRELDAFNNLITIHPTCRGREQVTDAAVLDFEMLQTGHGDRNSLPTNVRTVAQARAAEPTMPVFVSEVAYEGIGGMCHDEVQRYMFWTAIFSGAFGHTYGANGIWQLNEQGRPYGPSPHGMSWGDTPWPEASELPGSTQLGYARRILERYDWWRLTPCPETVEPRWSDDDFLMPYAAGIGTELRLLYLPVLVWGNVTLRQLQPDGAYLVRFYNPKTGAELAPRTVVADADGNWCLRQKDEHGSLCFVLPLYQDWVIALEHTGGPS